MEIAQNCFGHNQVDATVACYLSPSSFATVPPEVSVMLRTCVPSIVHFSYFVLNFITMRPQPLSVHRLGFGRLLFIVVNTSGQLEEINQAFVDEIEDMSSLIDYEFFVKPGAVLKRTVDCFTWGGA